MSLSSTSSPAASGTLLVRDVDGQYRPARAEEVPLQARRVLSQRVRRGATMSSPQAVKDYLLLEIGVLEHEVVKAALACNSAAVVLAHRREYTSIMLGYR